MASHHKRGLYSDGNSEGRTQMDWYVEQAMEIHRERMREIERYVLLRQARAELKRDTGPGPLDRSIWLVGRWLVIAGRRLQTRHSACVEQVATFNVPLSTLTR